MASYTVSRGVNERNCFSRGSSIGTLLRNYESSTFFSALGMGGTRTPYRKSDKFSLVASEPVSLPTLSGEVCHGSPSDKGAGFLYDYPSYHRLYGVQLHPIVDAYRVISPSQGDARGHNRPSLQMGGLGDGCADNQPNRSLYLPSTLDVALRSFGSRTLSLVWGLTPIYTYSHNLQSRMRQSLFDSFLQRIVPRTAYISSLPYEYFKRLVGILYETPIYKSIQLRVLT